MLFEGVVSDVFLKTFGSTCTIGKVTQDDGNYSGGVVDDFSVVFEITVLTGMKAVVIASFKKLGTIEAYASVSFE